MFIIQHAKRWITFAVLTIVPAFFTGVFFGPAGGAGLLRNLRPSEEFTVPTTAFAEIVKLLKIRATLHTRYEESISALCNVKYVHCNCT